MSDVAIVGAGPVGLTLAVLLGQAGWSVEVLERQPEPYGLPRAVHLDQEAARILQLAGVMEALAPLSEPMDAYEWRSADGRTLLRLEPPACSGWPASSMFSQPDLERLLERAAGSLPTVEVRRGVEVADIDGVSCRWIVGCDGADSTVRAAAGFTMTDLGYHHRWVVLDLLVQDQWPWQPMNLQICDPARPLTAVSGGPGRRRFELMCLPGEDPDELLADQGIWNLLERWGLSPANASIERRAVYAYDARLADAWRHGRVLLAGDAAHQMPPFAGQGLCSGLRDAANLAWKLDLVLSGRTDDALLDTYQSERAPQVSAEIAFSIELGALICTLDPAEAAARDDAMAAAALATGPVSIPAEPPLGPGVALASDVHAGELCPLGLVEHQGRRGRLDDVVGGGWLLLGAAGDPGGYLEDDAARRWKALGGRSVQVAPGAAIDDLEGCYARWFEALGAGVALVRPDFHVFGTAIRLEDAAPLIAAWWEVAGCRDVR